MFFARSDWLLNLRISRVLIGSRSSEYPWLFTVLRPGQDGASRLEIFPKDEICAINEAVVKTNTTKATNFGFSVFTD